MGHIYHCGGVDDHYLSPYQTRANWLPWSLRKSRPFVFKYRPLGPVYFNIWGIFTIVGVWMIITYHHTKPEPIGCLGCWEKAGPLYFNIGPWGTHISNYGAYLPLWVCGWSLPITIPNQSHVAALGHIYHCGGVDDHYLSPYQTRATWLPWLLRKSRPFVFKYRPLGPVYFNIWGIFTIVGVWRIITYHHTKPEPIGCLGRWEKSGPLYFNIGPLGPHTSNYGAYLPLWLCGWSLPITIPNQSHAAALFAKKKQALCI